MDNLGNHLSTLLIVFVTLPPSIEPLKRKVLLRLLPLLLRLLPLLLLLLGLSWLLSCGIVVGPLNCLMLLCWNRLLLLLLLLLRLLLLLLLLLLLRLLLLRLCLLRLLPLTLRLVLLLLVLHCRGRCRSLSRWCLSCGSCYRSDGSPRLRLRLHLRL
jgi:hypothetical protein